MSLLYAHNNIQIHIALSIYICKKLRKKKNIAYKIRMNLFLRGAILWKFIFDGAVCVLRCSFALLFFLCYIISIYFLRKSIRKEWGTIYYEIYITLNNKYNAWQKMRNKNPFYASSYIYENNSYVTSSFIHSYLFLYMWNLMFSLYNWKWFIYIHIQNTYILDNAFRIIKRKKKIRK